MKAGFRGVSTKIAQARAGFAKLTLFDKLNVVLICIGVLSMFLALLSLRVAVISYRDAAQSAREQQEILRASRNALEGVVRAAQHQQELFQKNLEIAQAHLQVIQEQWRRELERQARKPRLEVTVEKEPWDALRRNRPLTLQVNESGTGSVTILIRNQGDATLVRPLYLFSAEPARVSVEPKQVGGVTVFDIQPFSHVQTYYEQNLMVQVGVPTSE